MKKYNWLQNEPKLESSKSIWNKVIVLQEIQETSTSVTNVTKFRKQEVSQLNDLVCTFDRSCKFHQHSNAILKTSLQN